MKKYVIQGGKPLTGEVSISGAKNAVVAILTAAVLAESPCVIENIPAISDVKYIAKILESLGALVEEVEPSVLRIDPTNVHSMVVAPEHASRLRASYYFLGALLAKFGKAQVPLPGGCDFGVRPIDLHLKGFESLGASYRLERGVVHLSSEELSGDHIYFDKVTVGATINVMLAAVKAKGLTVIENAAKETAHRRFGKLLELDGREYYGRRHRYHQDQRGGSPLRDRIFIIPDQIEAGTFMAMAAATHGDVLVKNVIPKHMEPISSKLRRMGVEVTEYDDSIRVRYCGVLKATDVTTRPHPGFPTDMQPQIAAVLCLADGISIVREGVWDSRFNTSTNCAGWVRTCR